MTIRQFFRNALLYTLIITLGLTAVPKQAQAANLDSFISFLEQVEDKAGPAASSLPFTSQQVKDVKGVVECLENSGNDVDVAICIDEFHETGAGQQAGSEAEIPSWVYDLLDSYIMYRTGDYWGLAWKLGEAVTCIVIQILVGGADICGLLEELVQLAEDLWDAGKAVMEWFGSVGGAAWDAAKDVACAFGWGCDDEPNTPPEVWVYNYIFDAKLGEGLTARKSVDAAAFNNLINQLKANAAAKPPVFSTALPPDPMGILTQVIENSCANAGAVNRAAKIFTGAVNTQWTSDLGNNVLPLRSERYNQYNNPTNINFLTLAALQNFQQGQKWDPKTSVVGSCEQKFVSEFGFAHIDRWLGMVNELGDDAQTLKPAVQSNRSMCNSFWEINLNNFAEAVYGYTEQKYCGVFANTLMCDTIDNYRTCLGLLTPFNDQDKCKANTIKAGKEAAERVLQVIKAKGTAFPVWMMIAPQSTLGVSNQPYSLIGHRPTHTFYCQKFYSQEFGDLPQQLIQCSSREDTAYQELRLAVKAAVNQINLEQGDSCAFGTYIDPLIVEAATAQVVADLQQENRNFGFKAPSSKPGFDFSTMSFPTPIDGVNTPLVYYDLKGALEDAVKKLETPVEEKIPDMIDPLGPISDKLSGGQVRDQLQESVGIKTEGIKTQAMAPVAIKTFDQQAVKSQQQVMAPVAIKTFDQQAPAGQQQQTMSHTVPSGQVPSHSPVLLSTANKFEQAKGATILPAMQQLPDLQTIESVDVNGKKVRWNGMLTLDASSLKPGKGGRCQVPTRLVVKNSGSEVSSACQLAWPGISDTQALDALAPGKSQIIDIMLELPAGVHRLQLQLDKLGQVQESNEGNNSFAVTLRLNGTCGGGGSLNQKAPGVITVPQKAPIGTPSTKQLPISPSNRRMINPQPEPPGITQKSDTTSDFLLRR